MVNAQGMEKGWIKFWRKMQDNWLWEERRKYSKFEAWVDLLMSANHAPQKTLIGSELVKVERGEFITSQVQLAKNWRWPRTTVQRFLDLLQHDEMIVLKTGSKMGRITICNYGDYQESRAADGQQTGSKTGSKRAGQPVDSQSDIANGGQQTGRSVGQKPAQRRSKEVKEVPPPTPPPPIGVAFPLEIAGMTINSEAELERILKAKTVGKKQLTITPEAEQVYDHYRTVLKAGDKRRAHPNIQLNLNTGASPADLKLAADNYALTCSEEGTEQRFIKQPQNFYDGDHWKQHLTRSDGVDNIAAWRRRRQAREERDA